jgi:hypothetical protein
LVFAALYPTGINIHEVDQPFNTVEDAIDNKEWRQSLVAGMIIDAEDTSGRVHRYQTTVNTST